MFEKSRIKSEENQDQMALEILSVKSSDDIVRVRFKQNLEMMTVMSSSYVVDESMNQSLLPRDHVAGS